MKQPFKNLLFLIVFTISFVMTGQQASQGKVIISESELTSLIETILKHKNGVNQQNDSLVLINNSAVLNIDTINKVATTKTIKQPIKKSVIKTNEKAVSIKIDSSHLTNAVSKVQQPLTSLKEDNSKVANVPSTVSNEDLNKLSIEIQELKNQLTDYLAMSQSNNISEPTQTRIVEKQQIISPPVVITKFRDSIILIRDTIYITNNYTNYIDTISVSSKELSHKIIELQNRLNKKDSIIALLNKKPSKTIDKAPLKMELSNEIKLIYFANNVASLTDLQQNNMDKIVQFLNENNNISLHLKGYASNLGNANYNKSLSKQRIESVKNALLNQGIDSSKITIENLGIDFNEKNPSKARRVEIEIKKVNLN